MLNAKFVSQNFILNLFGLNRVKENTVHANVPTLEYVLGKKFNAILVVNWSTNKEKPSGILKVKNISVLKDAKLNGGTVSL